MRKLLLRILEHSTAMPFRRCGNIYKCFYCYETFHKASELKEHTSIHEDVGAKVRTVNRTRLKSCIKLDITELKCRQCNNEFDALKNFLTHLIDIHKENVDMESVKYTECFKLSDSEMKCLICDESFQFFNLLLLHTLRLHQIRPFTCESCGLSFSTKASLTKHTLNVHGTEQKTHKCKHCNKSFSTRYKLDYHEKQSHNPKARSCNICGQMLGSIYVKASHMAKAHNIRATEFKCDSCPKIFHLQHLLAYHTRTKHMKERTKTCEICGDKFYDERQLKMHMVRHSETKPFECEVCQKKFPRRKALVVHTRIHTGDKRCVCKTCGAAFVQTASLKLHERVHHGIGKKK